MDDLEKRMWKGIGFSVLFVVALMIVKILAITWGG